MDNYIKYQRFTKRTYEPNVQQFFDELIMGGWNIISYSERYAIPNKIENDGTNDNFLEITLVAGKSASLVKGIL